MPTINYDDDTWSILGQGATRDGKVYCHLASKTRFRQQKNGKCPIQIGVWIDCNEIEKAEKNAAITDYYEDRANSGNAALTAHR